MSLDGKHCRRVPFVGHMLGIDGGRRFVPDGLQKEVLNLLENNSVG